MRQRIIPISGCDTTDKVLLQIVRNDNGADELQISAWHSDGQEQYYQVETIHLEHDVLYERIIADFSELSANEFANAFVM